MKLSKFEKSIDSTILQRGKSYYQAGYVETLEEISDGKWEAQVEGTDLYTVEVKLSGDSIINHHCECPYDWGNVCKHEVAVFYALRNNKAGGHKKTTKKTTIKQKIETILGKLSEKEVTEYLQKEVLSNKKQRDHFLIHFDYLLGETPDPNKYRQIVQGMIYNYSDHGFIDYYASSGLCGELSNLLEQANDCFDNNPEQSLVISTVVLEAIPSMAESMDDSNGESAPVAYEAVRIILEYIKQADKQETQRLFQWCMQTYLDNGYSDYGYDEVDKLFNYFCTKESEFKDELLHTVDLKIAKSNQYSISYLLEEKAELLNLWGDESAAKNIIMANLDDPNFRQKLIDEKLENGDIDAAIKLIEEGIKVAEAVNHPGTVIGWKKQLLSIAQQQKNQDRIIHWTKQLLDSQFSMEHYRLLKSVSKNWASDYVNLLKQFEKITNALAEIYSEEKDHFSLFELIKSDFSQDRFYGSRLMLLKQYLKQLTPHYPSEILELFSMDIYQRAKTTGRNNYVEIVKDLKQMQKIQHGMKFVEEIVSDFQKIYKNRPAMQGLLKEL